MDNKFLETLKSRRSVRGYVADKMPSDEMLREIAEAGEYAPTGMGMQSPLIVVVRDKATRDKLSAMNAAIMGTKGDPFYGAPVVIVVLAKRSMPTHVYDGSLVIGNMLHAAHALGLGACWIHRAKEEFDSAEGRALLSQWGIEGDYEGIGHCVVGYPAEGSVHPAKPRKPDYVRFV